MVVASENTSIYKLFELVRDHDGEVTDLDVKAFGVNEVVDQEEMEWLCDALYMALSARSTSTPLLVVKGLRGDAGFACGASAWKRIFAELLGKTAQRASKLCSRVQNPRRLDSAWEVAMALERWEVDARWFERTIGKDMADLTKPCSLLQMVPTQFEKEVGQLAGNMADSHANA